VASLLPDRCGLRRGSLHVCRHLLRHCGLFFDRRSGRRHIFADTFYRSLDLDPSFGDRDRISIETGDLRPDLVGRRLRRAARVFTSAATTANPGPASPARADSIVAFNANQLIWLVMLPIISTMLLIASAALLRRS
jgi:hypothetical protein